MQVYCRGRHGVVADGAGDHGDSSGIEFLVGASRLHIGSCWTGRLLCRGSVIVHAGGWVGEFARKWGGAGFFFFFFFFFFFSVLGWRDGWMKGRKDARGTRDCV